MADETKKRQQTRWTTELREQALALLFVKSFTEVCEELNIPKATLSRWRDAAKLPKTEQKPKPVPPMTAKAEQKAAEPARNEQIAQFVREAWSVVIGSITELNRRITESSQQLAEINELIHYLSSHKDEILSSDADKASVVDLLDKIRNLTVIKTSELTTIMGVSYDKYALASGGVTERVGVSFEDMPE